MVSVPRSHNCVFREGPCTVTVRTTDGPTLLLWVTEQWGLGQVYSGRFSDRFIKEMTNRTGCPQSLSTFVTLLQRALEGGFSSSIQFFSAHDLDSLRHRDCSLPPPSLSSGVAERKFLILTVWESQDPIHFPLTLSVVPQGSGARVHDGHTSETASGQAPRPTQINEGFYPIISDPPWQQRRPRKVESTTDRRLCGERGGERGVSQRPSAEVNALRRRNKKLETELRDTKEKLTQAQKTLNKVRRDLEISRASERSLKVRNRRIEGEAINSGGHPRRASGEYTAQQQRSRRPSVDRSRFSSAGSRDGREAIRSSAPKFGRARHRMVRPSRETFRGRHRNRSPDEDSDLSSYRSWNPRRSVKSRSSVRSESPAPSVMSSVKSRGSSRGSRSSLPIPPPPKPLRLQAGRRSPSAGSVRSCPSCHMSGGPGAAKPSVKPNPSPSSAASAPFDERLGPRESPSDLYYSQSSKRPLPRSKRIVLWDSSDEENAPASDPPPEGGIDLRLEKLQKILKQENGPR